jgi:hypothetical protein
MIKGSINFVSRENYFTHRPDDGGSKDFWNIGKLLPDYTALQPRRQPSSYSLPWEPQILLIQYSLVMRLRARRPGFDAGSDQLPPHADRLWVIHSLLTSGYRGSSGWGVHLAFHLI